MLKKTITYKNFNNEEKTADLYFHIRSSEVDELVQFKDEFETWDRITSEPTRELTPAEIKDLLGLVKNLIAMSYGVRSEDGESFFQGSVYLEEFKASAKYDAFILSLFENGGQGADEFIRGILPTELEEVVEAQLPETTTGGELTAVKTEVPAWIRENREPTKAEFAKMSEAEKFEAFRRKSQN